jgi:hypothetical protein
MAFWDGSVQTISSYTTGNRLSIRWIGSPLLVAAMAASVALAGELGADPLAQGFVAPPSSAQPRVFWWWMQTKYHKEDITRDLEEMKRVGIGGALIWDNGNGPDPAIPQGPLYMGREWRETLKYAVKEANRLGIEISLNLSSGACCGGPWAAPEHAAQRLVWREKQVQGPLAFSEVLPIPDGTLKRADGRPVFYEDVAVLAFRLPDQAAPSPPLTDWGRKSLNEAHNHRTLDDYHRGKFLAPDPDVPGEPHVESRSVVDISKQMDASGLVRWDVPKGKWSIVRFGHTHTGEPVSGGPKNYDATTNGLYIDHLSRKAMDLHFKAMADTLIDDAGPLAGTTLKYLHCDSVEVGKVTWSGEFREEFRKRRGYDLLPFLPVLAGKIVDSREVSNRFLYDFRKTFGDCIAENHYGRFQELCHSRGLQYHAESGGPPPVPIDALECLGKTDIPMGEFWCPGCSFAWRVSDIERFFVRGPASAAHIYGKKLVAAEAFTNVGPQWEEAPFDLKPTADRAFCEGVNRFVLHTFSHSPAEAGKPGYEYFAGTHFNPNITWWPQAGAWTGYLARCQFLLQQGLFVGDVCYYYSDTIPSFVPLKHVDPMLGPGYDYDVTNSEVISSRMSVKDGRIVLPDGMSYRMLVLPEWDAMPLEVLRKITELVHAGATVVGPKPSRTPGLRDYPQSDKVVKDLADALWGPCDGKSVKEHAFGKGRVVWGKPLREILASDGAAPDFTFAGSQEGALLDYIHRSCGDAEIYFVANQKARWEEASCTFRVAGKSPELWEPDTGRMLAVALYDVADGRTAVPLRLAPYGSVFVVFRKNSDNDRFVSLARNDTSRFPTTPGTVDGLPCAEVIAGKSRAATLRVWKPGRYTLKDARGKVAQVEVTATPKPLSIDGVWDVRFAEGWGAPEAATFPRLISWTEHADVGVKYFSGTARYRKEFDVPAARLNDRREFSLDLGDVRQIAEVTLNGTNLGILWKPPFRVEITGVVKAGKNAIEVKVTNLWPNRLIGDQFLPKDKRLTNTNIAGRFTKDSPLMKSGLLGPVEILVAEDVAVDLDKSL